jgi:hypothetical protein
MKRILLLGMVFALSLAGQAVRTNSGFAQNTLQRGNDQAATTPVGFALNYFGQVYSTTNVSTNGNLTFGGNSSTTFLPVFFSSVTAPMIAPFYADVDTSASSVVSYGADIVNGRRAFGVNYVNVGYYDAKADRLNSFQVVLIERADTGAGNFDVEFNYDTINWDVADATRPGRAFAAVGFSNGLQGSQNVAFELPGSLVPGGFLNGGPFALNRQSRLSNGLPGRLVFEVRNGVVNTPTLIVQPNSTVRNCPELTLVARGSGLPLSSAAFQVTVVENGLSRPVTGFVATPVSGLAPGTYDFRVSYRSIPRVGDTGADPNSTVALGIVIPGGPNGGGFDVGDLKVIRNCAITLNCGSLPVQASLGVPVLGRAVAADGVPPYVYRAVQGVPPGLAFSSEGVLSGVPTIPGNYTLQLRVDDNSTSPVQFALTRCPLLVSGTLTTLTGACMTPAGNAGALYAGSIQASGGAGPYRFALTSGALPPGLSINSGGAIGGTIAASAAGSYPFGVTITDAAGSTAIVNCGITVTGVVIPTPSVSSFSPSAAVVGGAGFRLTLSGTNFTPNSVLVWNGFELATTFGSASSITANITANLLGGAGAAKLVVRNGANVRSGEFDFEVLVPLVVSGNEPFTLRSLLMGTPIVLTGDGFFPDAVVTLDGVRFASTRVSSQRLMVMVPGTLLVRLALSAVRVTNPNGISAAFRLNLPPVIPTNPTFTVDRPALITDQLIATVRLREAPRQVLDGELEINFVPAADNSPNNGVNDFPRFAATRTRRLRFTLEANATEFRTLIDQGTVAGTTTIALSSLTDGNDTVVFMDQLTQTVVVDAAPPLILPGGVVMVRTATGFNVEITALSTVRNLTAGSLVFNLATGVSNSGATTFSIENLAAASAAWFQSERGRAEGGGFRITLPFTFEGDFNNISSVQVTLTNSRGAGAAVSGGRR